MSFFSVPRVPRLPPFKKRTRGHQNVFKNRIVINDCLRVPPNLLREYIYLGVNTPTPAGIHTKRVYIGNDGGYGGQWDKNSFSGTFKAFIENFVLRAVFLGVTDFPAKLKAAGFLRDFCGRVAG